MRMDTSKQLRGIARDMPQQIARRTANFRTYPVNSSRLLITSRIASTILCLLPTVIFVITVTASPISLFKFFVLLKSLGISFAETI